MRSIFWKFYTTISNGITLQWGFLSMSTQTKVITLPKAYSAWWEIQVTDGGAGTVSYGAFRGTSLTQFTIYAPAPPASSYGLWWFTIGF